MNTNKNQDNNIIIELLSKKITLFFTYLGIILKILEDIYYLFTIIPAITTFLSLKTSILLHSLRMAYWSIEIMKTFIIGYYFMNHIILLKSYRDVAEINNKMKNGYYLYISIFIFNILFDYVLNYIYEYHDNSLINIFSSI
jgi:hypothetical protein